jgi:hypothetical protein
MCYHPKHKHLRVSRELVRGCELPSFLHCQGSFMHFIAARYVHQLYLPVPLS